MRSMFPGRGMPAPFASNNPNAFTSMSEAENGRIGEPFTLMSEVKPQATEWLWKPYVAIGELAGISGDPGVNKSTVTLDLAARVSTGKSMPGAKKKGRRGGVLLHVAEDSVRKTLHHRLKAAGAYMRRVAILEETLTIPGSLPAIEDAALKVRARLLIIDPLIAFLGRDANSDHKVRQALLPLRAVAERTNMAVLLIRHLTKSGGGNPLYRGSGSIGISATMRSEIFIGKHPDDSNMRVLSLEKNSLTPEYPSLLFKPVTAKNGAVRVKWRGECDLKSKDLLKPTKDNAGKLAKAQNFLLEALAAGPVEAKKVKAMAADAAIAWRTVERAKEILGIASRRKGWGAGSRCLWEMPNTEANA